MSHSRTLGKCVALLSLLVVLACALNAFGQGTQGSIAGVVRDASGAVVPGAKVTLTNQGTNQVLTATSSAEGAFIFTLINNGMYTVTIEKDGFQKAAYRDVQVITAQQYSLTAVLQVGSKSETVEVTAGQDLINTTSSEVAGTVAGEQVRQLPLNGRNPIELIRNQAGVPGILDATRNTTTVNGGRPGWTQTSQDGINVNDQFIRNNANDFIPTRPTSDSVAEFTVVSSNPGADNVGGASQVKMSTPSGTNQIHGSVYEFNRNSALAANDYWNKRTDPVTPKDQLNLNQFGGRIGGPMMKDKLFFFGQYEGYRLRQQGLTKTTIPAYDDYLTGTYRIKGNTVNVLQLINQKATAAGLAPFAIDPKLQTELLSRIKAPSFANATDCSPGANQTCYDYQQANPTNRDQEAFRFDYNLNQKHSFEFVFTRFTDFDARTDIDNINVNPTASLSTNNKLMVGAWRYTVSPTMVNELRMGDNTSTVPFVTGRSQDPNYFLPGATTQNAPVLTTLGVTAPDFYFMPQGRSVTTRQYSDNATWTKGNHTVMFGGSYNHFAPHTYNYGSVPPTLTFGLSTTNPATAPYRLTAADLAAAGFTNLTAADANTLNTYAGFLGGYIQTVAQTFQAKDSGSGFVQGYPNIRKYEYSIWSPYVQDSWRVKPNVTINAGLKWEYWTPLHELSNLALLPIGDNTKAELLNPNGAVGPVNGGFWKPDYKQFAPNFGIAWDPFKNGRTVIRGGYSMSFVNEDMITASQNVLSGNFGLSGTTTWSEQALKFQDGVPAVPAPAFKPVRTYADQLAAAGNGTGTAFGFQENMKTPYAHQINVEIQREVKWNTAIYARYIGTYGKDLWRGVDWNQQTGPENAAFKADFLAARSNMFNCGTPNPASGTCASAIPLTWFPTFDNGGSLSNSTVQTYIYYGQPGALVNYYVTRRGLGYATKYPQAIQFMPNPGIYASDELINGSESNYHALQLEARRALKNGFGFQINYTFSKLLSDSNGNTQNRFEPFIDNNNTRLDYGRSEYDLNHVVNANLIYNLPFGRGKWLLSNANGALDRIVGGWSISTITRFQSGNPFSIVSNYLTLNRRGTMPAYTTLSHDQVKALLGTFTDPATGQMYWINPKVLNPSGLDNGHGYACGDYDPLTYTPTFDGQVFYNPQPFEAGNMRRLAFNGPRAWNVDFSAAKTTRITERVNTEFRADFFNFFNHANFALYGDYNINNYGFGEINDTSVPNRIVQLSLRVSF